MSEEKREEAAVLEQSIFSPVNRVLSWLGLPRIEDVLPVPEVIIKQVLNLPTPRDLILEQRQKILEKVKRTV